MRAAPGARVIARSLIAACLAGCGALATAGPAHAGDCAHADATAGGATTSELASATLCVVNRERRAAGLRPLKPHLVLTRAARAHARHVVAQQEFAHRSSQTGSVADRVSRAGGPLEQWIELGENLGWGTFDAGTPAAIVDGWMRSPSHRDNVLYGRFDKLGVAVADGAPASGRSGALTYVAVFGQERRKRCTAKLRARSRARAVRKCRARGGAGEVVRR